MPRVFHPGGDHALAATGATYGCPMVESTASLGEMMAALDSREVSARELLDGCLDRIERLDGPINSVVTLEADRAWAEAAAVDDARATGRDVGPLAGVPTTIKDAIATEGIRSTGGATELTDHGPDTDAEVVTRLRDAGAVVFGKTNVPRWSGDVQTYNDIFGVEHEIACCDILMHAAVVVDVLYGQ